MHVSVAHGPVARAAGAHAVQAGTCETGMHTDTANYMY